MPARIVVIGSVNTDLVVRGPHIPSPGETVTGGEFLRSQGGKGANQAVSAARAGADVTFVARVGDDELGEAAVAGLIAEGVEVTHIGRDTKHPTGVALIMVDHSGENAISVAPGANARLSVDDVEAARPAIESADVLLMQLETPLPAVERAASIASAASTTVILNPAPARPLGNSLLSLVDVLTPNQGESSFLTNESDPHEAASRLRDLGVATVVVTLGAAGALIISSEGESPVPGFPVAAVDSTAAGDAFNGFLAVSHAEGLDLTASVRRACGAGALATTVPGARPSLPFRDSVDALVGSHGSGQLGLEPSS
jgi:ribokinase